MRVALFVTCVNDAVYPSTGIATVRLLERLGVEVDFPEAQTCCGQPQFNTGYRKETEPLVRRTAAAFEGYEYVVTPSGSCAAMVRQHYPKIGDASAASLATRTYELTEFLVDVLEVTDVGAYFPHTVTYHPSCHGLRLLGLGTDPADCSRPSKDWSCANCPAPTNAADSAAPSPSRTLTYPPPWARTRSATPSPPAPTSCAAPTTPV